MLRECFTGEGVPKKRLTMEQAQELVDDFPERNWNAYECSICTWWHVGERRSK